MGYRFSLADIRFLRSDQGVEALASAADLELSERSLIADAGHLRRWWPEYAAALAETVRLRRKARTKLCDAEDWLFTQDALQQATPTAVARHRAVRLASRAVHDVTCSIGADLRELCRESRVVIGSDVDPVRLAMATVNVPDALLVRADALKPCSRDAVIVADPARRTGAGRTFDPSALQPPLPDLVDACAGRDFVVKCAPGLDYLKLEWSGEVEIVSLDGAVRECALWSPGLTEHPNQTRATLLSSTGASFTLTGDEPDDISVGPPGQWIVDPDGAIVRAGLVRHYAARFGLWQLDPRIAYLTGDIVPPGARGHRVLTSVPLREKQVRRELSSRDCGSLEILVRGVDVDPDALRKRLKPRGSRALSLVITRIGSRAEVFICEPVAAHQSAS
ncbi:THUMP-like domain-containing protein [Hoyosella altamirensis]|uniref:THUMP-like domain-containing protein n=1 Tax=Hoyosella altamirensis TaxID=616997 RepID=A0A839RHG0_9ACTN|nr:hypothetical protein [Hoyosella altamirensis]MBB3036192.1 hypothetical protein [Hoyosella altamirensis]